MTAASVTSPTAIGFRRGKEFAEDVKSGKWPGPDGEDYIQRVLTGHRDAVAGGEKDRWCLAYSRGFLRGYEHEVFDHLDEAARR